MALVKKKKHFGTLDVFEHFYFIKYFLFQNVYMWIAFLNYLVNFVLRQRYVRLMQLFKEVRL